MSISSLQLTMLSATISCMVQGSAMEAVMPALQACLQQPCTCAQLRAMPEQKCCLYRGQHADTLLTTWGLCFVLTWAAGNAVLQLLLHG